MLPVLDPVMHDHRADSIEQARYCPTDTLSMLLGHLETTRFTAVHLDYLRSIPREIDLHDIGGIQPE